MATDNEILRKQALDTLRGNWGNAILTYFIYAVLLGIGQGISYPIYSEGDVNSSYSVITLIIGGPLSLGLAIYTLNLSRGKYSDIGQLFDGFKRFIDTFLAYLLVAIFTVLWTLLLIIPGIIKAISYSMTFFIMADDDSIKPMDAIEKSMAMMDGYKMKYFTLSLLFCLLIILSALLVFIPLLWLIPYMKVTFAKFYDDIKDNPAVIAH